MQNNSNTLYQKYNVPVPRYTSYPPVPNWSDISDIKTQWPILVKKAFDEFNEQEGISLYIHLPYCESLCTYCGCNTRITVNHAVETPYIQGILKEFNQYLEIFKSKPILREIHLGGGTPTFFSPANLEMLLQSILEKSIVHPQAAFAFEAHPANTTIEHLQTLYNLGFKRLSLGIQDFDPVIQKAINRKQSFEQVQTVVEHARKIGYESINFDIIYGLPFQTSSSVKDTISKILALLPERIAYYSYAHVPWKHPGQRAYDESHLPTDEVKRQLYELGKNLLQEKGYQNIGMDHFAVENDELFQAYQNRTLHRNFMGYVPFSSPLLIGLGVSAISDIYYAYGQNAKVVEEYLKINNEKKITPIKSHPMSAGDINRKKAINQILCNRELAWDALNFLDQTEKEQVLSKIQEMKSEGLLEYNHLKLKVTPEGLKFIRNIAAVFDHNLTFAAKAKMFSSSI